jgi:hypothetical protein
VVPAGVRSRRRIDRQPADVPQPLEGRSIASPEPDRQRREPVPVGAESHDERRGVVAECRQRLEEELDSLLRDQLAEVPHDRLVPRGERAEPDGRVRLGHVLVVRLEQRHDRASIPGVEGSLHLCVQG